MSPINANALIWRNLFCCFLLLGIFLSVQKVSGNDDNQLDNGINGRFSLEELKSMNPPLWESLGLDSFLEQGSENSASTALAEQPLTVRKDFSDWLRTVFLTVCQAQSRSNIQKENIDASLLGAEKESVPYFSNEPLLDPARIKDNSLQEGVNSYSHGCLSGLTSCLHCTVMNFLCCLCYEDKYVRKKKAELLKEDRGVFREYVPVIKPLVNRLGYSGIPVLWFAFEGVYKKIMTCIEKVEWKDFSKTLYDFRNLKVSQVYTGQDDYKVVSGVDLKEVNLCNSFVYGFVFYDCEFSDKCVKNSVFKNCIIRNSSFSYSSAGNKTAFINTKAYDIPNMSSLFFWNDFFSDSDSDVSDSDDATFFFRGFAE